MGKKRTGRLHKGPFTAAQIVSALESDGWTREAAGRHWNYSHPERPGKAQVSSKWTSVKSGSDPFKGLLAQTGYSKNELLRLLNGLPPSG